MMDEASNIKILHNNRGVCGDKEVVEKVVNFFKVNHVNTIEVNTTPIVVVNEYDDGDQGVYVKIKAEACRHANSYSKSIHNLVTNFWKMFPHARLYIREGEYVFDVCTHVCTPS